MAALHNTPCVQNSITGAYIRALIIAEACP